MIKILFAFWKSDTQYVHKRYVYRKSMHIKRKSIEIFCQDSPIP